jgi:hypothetical protein
MTCLIRRIFGATGGRASSKAGTFQVVESRLIDWHDAQQHWELA